MIFVLSPAKSLDYERPLPAHLEGLPHTRARLVDEAAEVMEALRPLDATAMAGLMDLSPALADLNVARNRRWSTRFTARNSRQAVLAFDGDVYGGLDARSLSLADLAWAQTHVRILSGLYGVLRPLDWIQPYRLEMGTNLPVGESPNLYRFWAARIAPLLRRDSGPSASRVLINLASQEYFKSVDAKRLKLPVVECVFEEWHTGQWKVISFNAKRARGLMARHAILKRAAQPQDLVDFTSEGYAWDAQASEPHRLVFRRKDRN